MATAARSHQSLAILIKGVGLPSFCVSDYAIAGLSSLLEKVAVKPGFLANGPNNHALRAGVIMVSIITEGSSA